MINKYDVVVIGDAFQDLFVFSNDFKVVPDRGFKSGKSLSFDYGAKIDVDEIQYKSGGSGVNTAISFANFEKHTALLSYLGNDNVAEKIKLELEEKNVEFIGETKDDSTNVSIILSSSGDRTILSYHGSNDYGLLPLAKSLKTDWFYLAPVGLDFEKLENKIIENIAKNASGLIWNPGPKQIKKKIIGSRHLLRLCNMIVLNREESFTLSGTGNIKDAMKAINDAGAKVVVVTDGKNGSRAYDGNLYYQIDISDDERIDSTGAGDAFASTFAASTIDGCGLKPQGFIPGKDAILLGLKKATINSGVVVGEVGANSGLLSLSDLNHRTESLVKLEASVYTQ